MNTRILSTMIAVALVTAVRLPAADPDPPAKWIEPMREVHRRFTGRAGTFAHFGDSITVTMAFWTPLEGKPRNMTA